MKNKFSLALLLFFCFFSTLPAFSQTDEEKQFISVWTPTKNTGTWGGMKIYYDNGKLLLEVKTGEELAKTDNLYIQNGTLYATIHLDSDNGFWKIGRWGDENNHILYSHSGASFSSCSSYGTATEIYARNVATTELNYVEFKCVLNNDNLEVYTRYYSDYTDDHGHVLFTQSSEPVLVDTYTN